MERCPLARSVTIYLNRHKVLGKEVYLAAHIGQIRNAESVPEVLIPLGSDLQVATDSLFAFRLFNRWRFIARYP